MSDLIEPCPFCGADKWNLYIVEVNGYLDSTVGIFCNGCKQTIILEENDQEGFTEEAKEKAIKAWNRREKDD